jgi:hypothetical protein
LADFSRASKVVDFGVDRADAAATKVLLMKHFALPLLAAVLAACASSESPRTAAEGTASGANQAPADGRLAQAATTPLNDLNLVRAEIPEVLAAAAKAPYAVPADASCPALAADVRALDAVLGADLDTPITSANPSLIERGSSSAGSAVVGAVRSTTQGVVPFRGWIRKLSGAERYERKVAAAIAAGSIRRGYLKGLGQAAGCDPPAAPRQ